MSIISLVIIIFGFVVGIYIGSVIFGKDIPEGVFVKQKKVEELEQQLKDAPMVLSYVFRDPMTKAQLLEHVLKPSSVMFVKHWKMSLSREDLWKNKGFFERMDKLAERIVQWYNPEYNQLLLIAHKSEACEGFVVDFTWRQPERTPKFICYRDAVEGLEKYYKDELGNPIVIYNQESK